MKDKNLLIFNEIIYGTFGALVFLELIGAGESNEEGNTGVLVGSRIDRMRA